jgi:hypothetical protein
MSVTDRRIINRVKLYNKMMIKNKINHINPEELAKMAKPYMSGDKTL